MSGPTEASKDVSMVDVSEAEFQQDPPRRRKSTLILTDEPGPASAEPADDNMHIDKPANGENTGGATEEALDPNITVPVDIAWVQGGEKVYVTGSFTGWRKMIGLTKQADDRYAITLGLPVGTHRFRFVIDNELRFSDYLPTATDQMGNFVNYIEVTPVHIREHLEKQAETQPEQPQTQTQQPQQLPLRRASLRGRLDSAWGLTNDDDDMGNGYLRYHDADGDPSAFHKLYNYISDIPPIFTDPKVMEQYYMAIDKQLKSQSGQQQAWLHPPQLPPHLENVILNNFNSMDHDNNLGALPIPNHVVLNHLATTSIKHSTLAVALVVRYKRKYVTQVLYAPLQQ